MQETPQTCETLLKVRRGTTLPQTDVRDGRRLQEAPHWSYF